jgi:signal transduction histidine kinase
MRMDDARSAISLPERDDRRSSAASADGGQFVNGWTHAATLLTTLAGLWSAQTSLQHPTITFWGAGIGYLLVLTWGIYAVEHRWSRTRAAAYFVLASGLLVLLLHTSRAAAWLTGLPLLSHLALFAPWPLAAVWGVGFMGVLLACAGLPWSESVTATSSTAPALLFVVVFSVMARRQTEWRLRAESLTTSLHAANALLLDNAAKIEELSAMRERNRVAREVHDGLGHYLTTIHVQLEAALALLDKDVDRARSGVTRAQLLARQGLQDVRESVGLLRQPQPPPRASLEQTLREVLAPLDDEVAPTPVTLSVGGTERRVPPTVEHALRRVLQEALTNVQRHARASCVEVKLEFNDSSVILEVADDGVGTPSGSAPADGSGPSGGYGLAGIRERILLLGGQVQTRTAHGGGFCLTIEVPA